MPPRPALGSGAVTVNSGGAAQLGYRETNTDLATVPNPFVVNGGAILANDAYQHISGNVLVTAAGGTLGSTYEGQSASYGWNKGLFIDGVLTGSGPLTLYQAGAAGELNGWGNGVGNAYNCSIVMFANNANSYSGTITVTGGGTGLNDYLGVNASTVLQYATINAVGNNSGGNQRFGSSTVVFQTGMGGATFGALEGSGNIVLTGTDEYYLATGGDAIALTVGGNGASTTYSGDLGGEGSLTKIGTGTMLLTNNSSYAGATAVDGGTLRLGVNQALPSGTVVTLTGGILNLNGYSSSISHLIVNISAMSQSNGALTVTTNSDGAVQLASAASSTASYTMSGGSLTVTAGPLDVGWYGSGTFNQTGGLVTTDNFLIVGRQTGSKGVYNISGGTVTNTGSFFGVGQQGSGTLYVSGSGLVVATSAGLSVGGLYGSGGNGTVNLLSGGRIQTIAVTTGGGISTFDFNGGTLQAAAGASTNFFSPLTNVVAGTGGAVIDSNGNDITFAAALGGSGGLTKGGDGQLVLTAGNTYTGPTTVTAGTLQLGNGSANGSIDHTGGLSLAAGAVVDYDLATNDTASYAIAGSGSLALTSGTLTLSGTDTYTGLTEVLDGTLILTSPSTIENWVGLFVGSSTSLFGPVALSAAVPASAAATSSATTTPVPEPGTLILLTTGTAAASAVVRRRKRARRFYS